MSPRRLLFLFPILLAAPAGCRSHATAPTGDGAAPAVRPAPVRGKARAFRVERPEELVGGPSARGRVGDYRMDNGHLAVIIDALGDGQGFAQSGGNIVDVGTPAGGDDHLNQIFTFFNREFPRQAIYTRLTIESDGARGDAAVLRVSGHDSNDPRQEVVTRYLLPPDEPYVTIATTLANRGAHTYRGFTLGDAIQWGATQPFVRGPGYDLGSSIPRGCDLIVFLAPQISYGWTTARGDLFGPIGGSWTDPNVTSVDLPPQGQGTYERHLIVGRGDVASVAETAYRIRGAPVGALTGTVREEISGQPVRDARVEVLDLGDRPVSLARADEQGIYRAVLPPGEYRVRAAARGRRAPAPAVVRVAAQGRSELSLRLSEVGRVRFAVREGGELVPAKLTFLGRQGTPDPWLGPRYEAAGAANVVLTGTGTGLVAMPPGRYQVVVSRGIEYDVATKTLEVQPGKVVALEAQLVRLVDTRGYLAADFHQHGQQSFDSPTSLADRVISNVAEGLEILVATDHNVLTDYRPTLRELGLRHRLKSIIGDEATTITMGHFIAFPLAYDPRLPTRGAPRTEGRLPREIFADFRAGPFDKVIQVNHPRAGDIGYFDIFRVDPATVESPDPEFDLSFDALEVLATRRQSMTEPVLRDWYGLLNRGFRVTATGNSDSHLIVGHEPGYPRNLVWVGKDAPAEVRDQEVVDAVKRARRVIVTTGPVVEAWVGGSPIGSFVPGKNVRARLRVKIQAAPWIDVRSVEVVVNGAVVHWAAVPPSRRVLRLDREIRLPLTSDSWVVVLARGQRPLTPVVQTTRATEPRLPLGFTNPIWVDHDGDGRFTPPNPFYPGK